MEANSREYQKAVKYLCDQIRNGYINVGGRIPTERAIAEELGISRNSTREAIRSLENMGIVESHRGSGNYYTGNVSKQLTEMIRTLLAIKHVTPSDISDFRRSMEKSVCLSIISHMQYDLNEAESILNKTPHSFDEEIEYDKAFHYQLIMASGNIFWIELMSAISEVYKDMIRLTLKNSDPVTRERYHRLHMKILTGLKERNWSKCETAINEHYDLIDSQLHTLDENYLSDY